MKRKGISSTVSALLITLVIVAGIGLAYTVSSRRLSREDKAAAEEALEAALSAVEQAIVRAVAEGLNQTVDVGVDASFEIRSGVLYARYRGIEASRQLPDLGVVYVDSSGSGGVVTVRTSPRTNAVFLSGPASGARGAPRISTVVFEGGSYEHVKISLNGRKAVCEIAVEPVVERARLPISLSYWGKATSPPGRPVYVSVARYAGRSALVVRAGYSIAWYRKDAYEFYAYYKRPLNGDIKVKGKVALAGIVRRWIWLPAPWMPEPPKKGGAGGRVYLYVLDAGDPSKIIKRYEIPAGGWGWRGFEVDLQELKEPGERGYVIATRPLTSEDWLGFTLGELVVFKDGMIAYRSSMPELSSGELEVLRFIRRSPHRVSLRAISEGCSMPIGEAAGAVRRLLSKGLIKQDSRDTVNWSHENATFYTNPYMRSKIDQTIRAG